MEEPNTDITWEEFINTYSVGEEEYQWRLDTEDNPPSLHDKVEPDLVFYYWEYEGYPRTKAYRFLDEIDLGEELSNKERGSINFYDGFSPMHDCQIVAAADLLSLSLLQQRLNQLTSNIAIETIVTSLSRKNCVFYIIFYLRNVSTCLKMS